MAAAIVFLEYATVNTLKGFGNILLNGFKSDLSKYDKTQDVGLRLAHFRPVSKWSLGRHEIVDKSTGDEYCNDSKKTVRLKCAALFAATLIAQPIALTLNLLNRIGKVVTFAHLWNPSKEKYSFKARLCEWVKDLAVIVTTPLILVGMVFSALYGAIISPYNGRKLFGTFERLAFSGGYQFFDINGGKNPQKFLLAPCFQPDPTAHLGGGRLGERNVW